MCKVVAIMPRFVRNYILQEVIFFILHYIVRYRRKVIMENLRNSFPEKSERELRNIARRCNLNLAEQFINIMSLAGASHKRLKRMFRFAEAESYKQATANSDVVCLAGHYGCWEFMNILGLYDDGHKLLSVYHPLSSNTLDDFFKRIRNLENTELVPREDSLLYFMRNRGKGKYLTLGLIADQNRFWYANAHWITFLNQDTIFANGGELIARKLSIPVWMGYMRRRRRGEYEFIVTQIYDGHEAVAENEITERYAHHLEQVIRECPELWLWSHRRWKHKRNMNL
jgi:KDO2-lipid IV(A) lauroyltransferase